MTLDPFEFIRRFLIHVLPKGFHRIRHYGLFANGNRTKNITRARQLLSVPPLVKETDDEKGTAGVPDPRQAQMTLNESLPTTFSASYWSSPSH
jgi:hypothetical protein